MPSELNKPTGLGFQGSPWRICTQCDHQESSHYGSRCFTTMSRRDGFGNCTCRGFSSRELSAEEKAILDEEVEKELEYVGEALYIDLKKEAQK